MDLPDNLLDRYTKPQPHSPRSEWEFTVDSFYARINTPASVKKFGEISHGRIARLLKGKSRLAIEQLFAECKKARSFAGLFLFLTKPKTEV